MSTMDLMGTYSVVGDIISLIFCVAIILIVHATYVKMDKRYTILQFAMTFLIIGIVANIIFYKLIKLDVYIWQILFCRDVVHVSFLLLIVFYILYAINLVRIEDKERKIVTIIASTIFVFFAILDCISPLTHYGLYYENGLWYDKAFIKPYGTGYILNSLFLVGLIFKYRARMVKKVSNLLIFVSFLCIIIVVAERIFNSNTFLSITLVLPLLMVVFIFHSHVYQVVTGSRDFFSFANYLEARNKLDKKDWFMCLELKRDTELSLPEEVSKLFCGFYDNKLTDSELFTSGSNVFVLAIKEEKNNDIATHVKDLVENDFANHYKKYNIDYKICIIPSASFDSFEQFERRLLYFFDKIEEDSYKIVEEKDYEEYKKSRVVLENLKSIAQDNNLEDERVLAFCQPVINTETGKYDTAEALMRLNIPEIGMVFPDLFIPLAEKYNYIHTLTNIILHKTCKEIRKLLDEGYSVKRVSVNFSIIELEQENFMEDFERIISSNNIPFSMIGVELTESQNDKDYNMVYSVVEKMKKLGNTIYLDDFGTGYSNFARILQMEFDIIKFDRSLLLMADEKIESQTLIDYFSKAFSQLGYELVFEGVETEAQEKRCVECKAKHLQGYKFSRPIPIEKLRDFFERS